MQIAGIAERMERQYGQLAMTVLKPEQNTAAAVKALRGKFMRHALAPAGIWTVEVGEQFAGLHLNIISPRPLQHRWKKCETYSELLRTTARDAAAYIAKRSGMPAKEQFCGDLWGRFGQIGEILAGQQAAPVVQAAAVEVALSGIDYSTGEIMAPADEYRTDYEEAKGWIEGKPVNGRRVWWTADGKECTYKPARPVIDKEKRAEVMRRNLPNLYAAIGRAA